MVLRFQVLSALDRDYKAFAHLVASDGRIVAQDDRAMEIAGRRSRQWSVGDRPVVGLDVWSRGGAPSEPSIVRIGLYDETDGRRLEVEGQDHLDLGSFGGGGFFPRRVGA
jgi:hypothetical protein